MSKVSCVNCLKPLDQNYKGRLGLTSTPKNKNFSSTAAIEGMYALFNQSVKSLSVDENGNTRYICTDCNKNLLSGFESLNKFFNAQKEGCYFKTFSSYPSQRSVSCGQDSGDASEFAMSVQVEALKIDADNQAVPNESDSSSHLTEACTPKRQTARKRNPATPCKMKLSKFHAASKTRLVMQNFITSIIREELTNIRKDPLFMSHQITRENWLPQLSEMTDILKLKAPFLHRMLLALLCKERYGGEYDDRLRTVIGVVMNAWNRKANVFQKMVGVILFTGQASTQVYEKLQAFGITCSYKTSERALEEMGKEFDKDLLRFKHDMEQQIAAYKPVVRRTEFTSLTRLEDLDEDDCWLEIDNEVCSTPKRLERDRKGLRSRKQLQFDDLLNEKLFVGGTFISDNINHVEQTYHHNSKSTASVFNMTSVAFIPNRISMPMAEFMRPPMYNNAREVPESAFLPTEFDDQLVKQDHKTVVKQILCKNLKIFSCLQNTPAVEFPIKHEYSEASKQSSKLISLGIIDENQATHRGTRNVIHFMEKYLPTRDGKMVPAVAHGDCLTFKMMNSASVNSFNSIDPDEMFNSIYPGLGQFHLRMHLLEDVKNVFMWKGKKQINVKHGHGSVPHLLSRFNHPEKIHDVKHNFNIAERGYTFGLLAYVLSFACNFLEIQPEELDEDQEMSEEERVTLLERVTEAFVEFEWQQVVRKKAGKKYCVCQKEYSETEAYIACSNNKCEQFVLYHVNCIDSLPRDSNFLKPPSKVSKLKYYCTEECRTICSDTALIYTQSFCFAMLMHDCYKRAIRYNDHRRMDAYNKFQLIEFSNMKHSQYQKAAFISQARKHGWGPRNVSFDLKHNSTINLSGKSNKNLEADLVNESLNRWMKDHVIRRGVRGTARSIVRNSRGFQISMDFKANFKKVIAKFRNQGDIYHHKEYRKYKVDLIPAIKIVLAYNLVTFQGKRDHEGHTNFCFKVFNLEEKAKLKKKLKEFADDLDDAEMYKKESMESINSVVPE